MPIPYSYDLRTKVINAIDEGMSKTEASRIFQISRNTINLWLRKREQTGDYKAEAGYQKGYNPKIADLKKFEQFAQAHGSLWTEKISDRTIGKALKKLNYTRKKNLWIPRTKRREETRVSTKN